MLFKDDNLFDVWDSQETITTVIVFFAAILAAGGGIGGGGIYVPIFILVMGLDTKEAIALSHAMIFGGSIVNIVMYSLTDHPTIKGKSLANLELIMLILPMMLFGSVVGVFLNIVSPTWLLILLLIITLYYSNRKTIRKGRELWKKETSDRKSVTPIEPINPLYELPSVVGTSNTTEYDKRTNRYNALKLLIIWFLVLLITLFRGGKEDSKSIVGIETCSPGYWILSAVYVPIIGGICYLISRYLLSIESNEIVWTNNSIKRFCFFGFISGMLGGMLGIGGGIIIGPILVSQNLDAHVVSATLSTMVFMNSLLNTIQFFIIDALDYQYALFFMGLNLIATSIGYFVIRKLVERSGRKSLIILSIASVIMIATVMLTYIGVTQLISDIKKEKNLSFSSPCGG